PLGYNFDGAECIAIPHRIGISTDYYYGFSPNLTDQRLVNARNHNPSLAQGIKQHWRPRRLIDMETAQFYHFCSIYGAKDTQYVAIRGIANLADQFETQGDFSQNILTSGLELALVFLGITNIQHSSDLLHQTTERKSQLRYLLKVGRGREFWRGRWSKRLRYGTHFRRHRSCATPHLESSQA
ncbi:MAG TPA: hypothetical protein PKA48_10440, partial [Candidatus Obscuribacter sp.]|nr:hypothetical protein [Candidatus Obscuribacter sp.]